MEILKPSPLQHMQQQNLQISRILHKPHERPPHDAHRRSRQPDTPSTFHPNSSVFHTRMGKMPTLDTQPQPDPPPFRQNIWLKTNKSTRNRIKAVYHNILQTVVSSPIATKHSPLIPHLHRSDVIWKLALLFESLILFPFPKTSKDTTATIITKRLHLFRIGNIKQLFHDSRGVISKTPLEKSNRAGKETISTRNKCAQLAADTDNYRSAIDRVMSDTPIAINTPDVVEILKDLYPDKHILHDRYK